MICRSCEFDLPETEFWPNVERGRTNVLKYLGRWEICRHCVASHRPEIARPEWADLFDEPPPPRLTLRERFARTQSKQ